MLINRFFARLPDAAPSPVTPSPLPASRSQPRFKGAHSYLLTPLVSIIVFTIVMGLILWSLNRHEQQQQEDALYRNVAWTQQQIHLALTTIQRQIIALSHGIARGHYNASNLKQPVAEILQAHPEIIAINWLDPQRQPYWEPPLQPSPNGAGERFKQLNQLSDAQLSAAMKTRFAQARDLHRQIYAPLIYDNSGNSYLSLQTPIYYKRDFLGTLVTLFAIKGILSHELPLDLFAKYKISIYDAHGRELATSSSRPPLAHDAYYDLPLNPPGGGLMVRVYASPQAGANITNHTLVWLVVGLSCFVLWNLWSLWRHMRERFAVQQALYAEASFRRAIENSTLIGIRVLDMQGCITHVNPAFCRMTGWDETELIGKTAPLPYWPRDAYPEMRQLFEMTLRGQAPASGFEIRVRRKDDSDLYARLYVSPLIDNTGQQTGWIASMIDVTEPKRAREGLVAAHERFTTVLENLDAAVSVLAPNQAELLFANRYYRHLFGARADGHLELAGTIPHATDTPEAAVETIEAALSRPAARLAETYPKAREIYLSRIQKWFEVRCQSIQWVDGQPVQTQIATDITHRKQAQELARQQNEKLQFTSRLITMGEMASSLAHELNQPLAAINNYCSGAIARVKAGQADSENLLPALEKTAQQAVRAGMIIKRIGEFVKRSEPKRQHVRLNDIIADAVGLMEIDTRKRHIRVVTEMPLTSPAVYIDPVLIEQVLINLIKNAAEAIHEHRPDAVDPVIRIVMQSDHETVQVSVIDQGPGIDEASAERLFEPFYSTKLDGMGMGLNICRSIIEAHRGRLWVTNMVEPDGTVIGAAFHFCLPLCESSVPLRL